MISSASSASSARCGGRESQAELREPLGFERARLVRAAHIVPELEQERGDSAHPAPGNADQMDRVPLLGEEFLEIEFRRRRRHGADCIFPSFRRPIRPRFSARARAACSAMVRSVCGIAQQVADFSARAVRPRTPIPSKARRPLPGRKSRRCASGDRPPHRDRESRSAGSAKARQLGQAGRAGARDRKIGRAVNFLHLMMKRRDMRGNVFAPVIIRQQPLVAAAGEMNHLERRCSAATASP